MKEREVVGGKKGAEMESQSIKRERKERLERNKMRVEERME